MATTPDRTQEDNKGARFLLVAACLVVVIAGLKAAASLILPLLVSIFLALITIPLLNWLQRRKVPDVLAILVTLAAAIAVLAAILYLIGGSLASFTAAVPKYKDRLGVMTQAVRAWMETRGLRFPALLPADVIDPGAALDVVAASLRAVAVVLSNLMLVFLTIAFILFEAAGFPAKLQAAFGQQAASERLEKVKREVQLYLGIKTLISVATGGLVGGALALIGVDYPLLWGALAFLLNYIPTLGSILAAVPPVLLATVDLGIGPAALVAGIFLAINVLLGSLAEPYLMGRRLGLSTLVIFLSLVFWGWVWGPVGMLLSVPLTMIVKILLENTPDLRWIAVLLDAAPALGSAPPPGPPRVAATTAGEPETGGG